MKASVLSFDEIHGQHQMVLITLHHQTHIGLMLFLMTLESYQHYN